MGKITDRVVLIAGAVILVAATWFAFKTPAPSPLPVAVVGTSSSATDATATADTTGAAAPLPTTPAQSAPPKDPNPKIVITITAPTSSAQWTIGQQNTITWSAAAGTTARISLTNAANGTVVGWIEQTIAPSQTYFPWNTRDVFISRTSPLKKDVSPGKYFLTLSFASTQMPAVTSSQFLIVAPPTK